MTIVSTQDSISMVPVAFHNCLTYLPGNGVNIKPFAMEVTDQRNINGQLCVDLGSIEGEVDNALTATFEINRLDQDDESTEMPCLHLGFDSDNLAGSFFKQGNRYIFRPQNGVKISQETLPNGTAVLVIE